ncbi:hypothetical protein NQ315_003279 [Exocentrus adspersus]|uniref:Uncharacterized protein n=1 Tax=Exocentrus adspersus TaxID=1586481 RepID=A0AAV8VDA2_9CUCU|nr:hypothetical protein NQ315_003279 [Exocentrus adspersus]
MENITTSALDRPDMMSVLSLFVNPSIAELWQMDNTADFEKNSPRKKGHKLRKQFFLQMVVVDLDGRYEIRLPCIDGHPSLPTNYNMANKRLQTAIGKLKRNNLRDGDREFLKFLWIDTNGEKIDYRHRGVVFGVNCSPFLLGVTLQYHHYCLERSKQQGILYSEQTVKKLMKSFYVNNCVTSVENKEYLVEFIEAKLAMMEGKFNLRGWEFSGNTEDEDFNVSVLGLKWYTNKDEMVINYELLKLDTDEEWCVTKRKMLSQMMAQKVFDPIGFTCPTTLIPKLILQKLWKEKIT